MTGERWDYLDLDDVLAVAEVATGKAPQVREWGLLASAVQRPQATAFGHDAYPELPAKAAALLHALARNHPLMDGNKRTAWVAARLFAALNGADLRAPDVDAGEKLVVDIATGSLDAAEIREIIAGWFTGPAPPR